MQIRWGNILPFIGLALFAVVSYQSARINDQLQRSPNRYFWWSSLRLDSDPLNLHPKPPERCQYDPAHCADWDVSTRRNPPGWLDRVLVLSALPAFLAGFALVLALARKGVNEVMTFMVSMPMLLYGWYYFVGWLIEYWVYRRKSKNVVFKIT
jgi:hypothetical protein